VRAAHLPHRAPTLRYFAAGGAVKEIEKLAQTVKSTGAVPSGIALGGSYEPEVVLDVLDHLALYWSPPATGEESAAPQGQVAADRDLRLRRSAGGTRSHR